MFLETLVFIIIILCVILFRHFQWYKKRHLKRPFPVKTMIIMGSGGHTREILSLSKSLSPVLYSPRFYIASIADDLSRTKAEMLEMERMTSDYSCWRIYRSREVAQSWVTSVFTTAVSLLHSFFLICYIRPELIVCNGPGVCVPLCAIAFAMKILGISKCKILYVESVCRIQRLSLSGKILRFMADDFLVQWRHMAVQFPFAKFIGRVS